MLEDYVKAQEAWYKRVRATSLTPMLNVYFEDLTRNSSYVLRAATEFIAGDDCGVRGGRGAVRSGLSYRTRFRSCRARARAIPPHDYGAWVVGDVLPAQPPARHRC